MRHAKWLIAASLIAATTAACTEQYGYPETSYNSGYYYNNGYNTASYNNGYYYPNTAYRPNYYNSGYYYPSTAYRPNYYYNSAYYPNVAYRYRDLNGIPDRYERTWW